jgi:hypothetical protein
VVVPEISKLLTASIDVKNVTVRPFDGYIFICGGSIEVKEAAFSSVRHYALSRMDADGKIAGHRIMIAEKMTSLLQGDDFGDLIEFEEHIAALSACVLIFVESPGSIAELGSFSVMPNLASRLLVVCEQRMESTLNPSFIFLGPIASLRKRRIESVQVFPIFAEGDFGPDTQKLDDCWEYIEESVLDSLKRPVSEASFDKSLLAHQMVMTAAVIDLFVAVKFGELESILEAFGAPLSSKELRRIVRMLEQFSLIQSVTYGHDKFFFSLQLQPLVTFRPAKVGPPSIFDPIRFKARVIEIYEDADERRAKAIRSFLKGQRK